MAVNKRSYDEKKQSAASKTQNDSAKGTNIRSYAQLAGELAAKRTANFYVLFGDEEYLIERAVKALSRLLIAPGCQDADSYTADWISCDGNPESLKEMVSTPPFLSSKRMVIIKNSGLFASRSPDSPEAAQKYISIFSDIPDFCCLILIEEKIDKRKKVLLEAAGRYGFLVSVDRQSSDALCKWVGSALHKENIRITMEALNSLVDRTEGNMRVLGNEIQKIILYCTGSGISEISLADLEGICIPDIRGSIFQMTDAIGTRNIGRALTVLDTLISMKEPVTKIRFMLSRHLRQLICAKELSSSERIMSELKVVPFVARNLSAQARYFKMEELVALYEACALSDFSVKTGKIEDRLSLETLLVGAGKEPLTSKTNVRLNI